MLSKASRVCLTYTRGRIRPYLSPICSTPSTHNLLRHFHRKPNTESRFSRPPTRKAPPFQNSKELKVINEMISDSESKSRLLYKIRRGDLDQNEIQQVHSFFVHLLHWSAGNTNESEQNYRLACEIWQSAFHETCEDSLTPLQALLCEDKSILVNILMNAHDYKAYETYVKPVVDNSEHVPHEWCDTVAQTLQLSSDIHGQLTFNKDSIASFINNNFQILYKRKLLAIFVRKAFAHKNGEEESVIRTFVKALLHFEDRHCLFTKADYVPYKAALYSIANYMKNGGSPDIIKGAFRITRLVDNDSLDNFITSLMYASNEHLPNVTLDLWSYKKANLLNLTHDDLTYTLKALYHLNRYDDALQLSKQYPMLYHDDQLSIFLKISEAKKDWKMLQEQFEAMYGRGHLPYAIHYSIVMNALASSGAQTDIDRLYDQLQKRKIKPTSGIFAALMKVRIVNNQPEQVKTIFEQYLEEHPNIGHLEMLETDIYRILFSTYIKSGDKRSALEFFERSIDRQRRENVVLVDSKMVVDLLNFFIETYGLQEIEKVRNICIKLDLMTTYVYSGLAKAYTTLGQFERAEDLIFEAHHESLDPFKSSDLLAAQLRNYRMWYTDSPQPGHKLFIEKQRRALIRRIKKEECTSSGIKKLYAELLRFDLSFRRIGFANGNLESYKKINTPTEAMYLPFLKFFSSHDKIDYQQKVISTYKEMVRQGIPASVGSYKYLMRALLFLDKQTNQNFHNSEKLLHSVLEIYGFPTPNAIGEQDQSAKVSSLELSGMAAMDLCHIVSDYVLTTPSSLTEKADFVVEFLSHLKTRLNNQMNHRVRFTVYKEMGRLFHKLDNLTTAKSLIWNGITELTTTISEFIEKYPFNYESIDDIRIPRSLRRDLEYLVTLHIQTLQKTSSSPSDFKEVVDICRNSHIQLNGFEANAIIDQLMKLKDFEGLHHILYLTENHLVPVNMEEVLFMSHLKELYEMFIYQKSKVIPESRLFLMYKDFNAFYKVPDLAYLNAKFKDESIAFGIRKEVSTISAYFPPNRPKLYEYFIHRPEIFLSPERRLTKTNKLFPITSARLYLYILRFCQGQSEKLYDLMTDYPLTIEFILWNKEAKVRLENFRNKIDLIIKPPGDKTESFKDRQERTRRAIHRLFHQQWEPKSSEPNNEFNDYL